MPVRRPLALVTATLATLAAPLLVPLLAAGPAAALDPTYQQPAVGSCHAYAYAQVDDPSESTPPVDCAGAHTAETVAVVQVPSGSSGATASAAVLPPCYAALKARLGGKQQRIARTAYDITIFRPDDAQLAQGARWVRCDLVLLGGRALQPLPTPLLEASGRIPTSVALCAKGRGAVTTTCDRPHTLRAGRTLTSTQQRYPGRARLSAQVRRCRRGSTILFPVREQWKIGLRTSVCLVRTRD